MKQACQILLFPLSSDHFLNLSVKMKLARVQIEYTLTGSGRDGPVFWCVYIVDIAVDFNWQQLTSTVDTDVKIRSFRPSKPHCNFSLSAANNSTQLYKSLFTQKIQSGLTLRLAPCYSNDSGYRNGKELVLFISDRAVVEIYPQYETCWLSKSWRDAQFLQSLSPEWLGLQLALADFSRLVVWRCVTHFVEEKQ